MANEDRKPPNGVDPRASSRVVVDGAPSGAGPRDAARRRLHGRGLREAAGRHCVDLEHASRPATCTSTALAREAAAGADAAGAKSIVFNTITVSDGISMGTPGMRYSLVSREVIADSIETVAGAEGFDGLVAIGGCDKNMPGCAMAMARLEPAGGVRLRRHDPPGHQASRHHFGVRGRGQPRRRQDRATRSCKRSSAPRSRARARCGGMYTANTMASAIEALGLEPRRTARRRKRSASDKSNDCRRAGEAVVRSSSAASSRRDILTQEAFENAITTVIALGGSTNAVLHLLAIAHDARGRAHARRLHAHRRARAGARGSAAERPLPDVGADRDRRHPAAA